MIFSTKANTLIKLKQLITKSTIEDLYITTQKEYENNRDKVIDDISKKFSNKIIIRSSAKNEDNLKESNAGHYKSILNINSKNRQEIKAGINYVLSSYTAKNINEQILIQNQTNDILYSGVIFTRDINKNRPYYVINYTDNGSTTSITGGSNGKVLYILNNTQINTIKIPWNNLITATKEIEEIIPNVFLDIEFAIKNDGAIVIFQVRPLTTNNINKNIDNSILKLINDEKAKYINLTDNKNKEPMLWSNMAFWNPAEIIGTNPRELDYSLYEHIITDKIWNRGIVPLGYKKVDLNLMHRFANSPYISLNYTFRSLIPKDIPEYLAEKLIKYYESILINNTSLHDKIEFKIVYSCFDFSTSKKIAELSKYGFTKNDIDIIQKSLFHLTKYNIKNYFKILDEDKKSINYLENKRKDIEKNIRVNIKNENLIENIETLLSNIIEYGTIQFARQARFAFIAKSFLISLIDCHYFTNSDIEKFMESLETITDEYTKDMYSYLSKELSEENFKSKYGHLRTGTYDITSKKYSEIDFYKTICNDNTTFKDKKSFILNKEIINNALKQINMDIEADYLIKFIKTSIEQREYFKFEFTKSLSLVLEIISRLAKKLDITPRDIANLNIKDIILAKKYVNDTDIKEFWYTLIYKRGNQYLDKKTIILPDVIIDENSFNIIFINDAKPTFITEKITEGNITEIDNNSYDKNIRNKIVITEKADPGYDYIFSQEIKGLITKYGGVASHMSIRCSELGIPAVIGCGENLYNEIKKYKNISIDCKNGKITEVK